MKYKFKGKNITVTDALKNKIEEKINKLEKFLPQETNVNIKLSVEKIVQKIEATIHLPKRILRAEVESDDMYLAIDDIVNKLERQIIKYKNRLKTKSRKDDTFNLELENLFENENHEEENEEIKIIKTKKFEVKPMDVEEAIMEMELVSHNFFLFKNSETNEIALVYKRKDGNYGLIESE